MTEIKCPCCGSGDTFTTFWYTNICRNCDCHWDESKRQPSNVATTGDKAECLNLYEEAVDLIDSLNSEQRLDYSDYSLLRDAVDAIGICIEENIQPPNAWIPCSDRLPEEGIEVLASFPEVKIGAITFVSEIVVADYFEDGWFVGNNNRARQATHWQALPQPPETGKDGE